MNKKTRKAAAAEIRKLREENEILKREVRVHYYALAGAREEKEKLLGRIATLESKVAYYKKDAGKAFILAEKYFDKTMRWRLYFLAELAGVVIGVAIWLFLK
jgi:hypothetical protein